MKKVTLPNISRSLKFRNRKGKFKYEVYLGNGTAHVFESERIAKQFINQTNQFLTQQLYELRNVFLEVQNQYNVYWCYLNPWDTREFTNSYPAIEQSFDFISNQYGGINHNYTVFHKFGVVISYSRDLIKILQQQAAKKSFTTHLYTCDNLIRRINLI